MREDERGSDKKRRPREAMGKGAPQTRQWFEQLALAVAETMPQLELVFRSDRDGPLPDGS